MSEITQIPQRALRYEAQVNENGIVEVNVPFQPGTRVMILIIEEPTENFDDLLEASQSSLDFWDNPFDDEDWNNVGAR